MRIEPLGELRPYQYDREAEGKCLRPRRLLGYATLLLLASTVLAIILIDVLGMIPSSVPILVCGAATLGAFFGYMATRTRKNAFACLECQAPMTVQDVDWTEQSLQDAGIRLSKMSNMYVGEDGKIYTHVHQPGRGSTPTRKSYVVKQRWYVCHPCKRYFLYDKMATEKS